MKPANLIYGLDETPPPLISFILGLQHVCIFTISLVFPVILVSTIGGTTIQAAFMVSMSMLAGGVGVIVQSLRKGPVGSGYLCPEVCGPSFISASVLAAKTGGIPLMLGMTMFAGLFEGLFSRIMNRLRFMFPTEVTGLIVAMVGITVVKLASLNMLGMTALSDMPDAKATLVGFSTLSIMMGLNVWSKGKLRLFCIIIGMACGYLVAFLLGVLDSSHLAEVTGQPMFWMPLAHHPGWGFAWSMVPPFVVAMLCSSLKSVGDLTTCQKANDSEWVRSDMFSIRKGILADGVGCFSAGLLGGFGQSTSSANIGLSIATGATSRVIALFMGGILAALAFCPKLSAVFAIMPKPVIGATLIFALSFMVVAGFQIIMSRMMDNRKTFVVGISLILGLMVDMVPHAVENLPHALHGVLSSSLATATLAAVLLNLLFRIGIANKATLTLKKGERVSTAIADFMTKQGGAWSARKEVFQSAQAAVTELSECIVPASMEGERIDITLNFDEYTLKIDVEYQGQPVQPSQPIANLQDHPADTCLQSAISWQLIQHYVKNLKLTGNGEQQRIRLTLDH